MVIGQLAVNSTVTYSNLWDVQVTLQSRSTFQNLESTMSLAELGKGVLFLVEQVFVGREEIQAP